MTITLDQAYRPILWKQPNEMDDNWLLMAEIQLRMRNPEKEASKKDEILNALNMVRDEIKKRNLEPYKFDK